MRLGALSSENGRRACAIVGDEAVDLPVAAPDLPAETSAILALGEEGLEGVEAAIESGRGRRALSDVSLTAPVRPQKFFGIGLNYADHAAEANRALPEFPTVFAKMVSCVAGPYDPIERPLVSEQLDYEGELAVVIGRRCRHVTREDAPGVVGGYTITNDVSVRDWQRKTPQWTLGKSFDTHGPLGPWIVTPDELGDPHDLGFRTLVNSEVRQQSNTNNLIFNCWDLIAEISTACTLEPGDVIATGTCSGVAAFHTPPLWLQEGDVVRIEFDRIGAIENRIVREPARVAVAA
jgi:2-keto-4-pentenoate hydratase/2-oxohepta-3-ene-1,7-dioic acid hydratase in catechol pathway